MRNIKKAIALLLALSLLSLLSACTREPEHQVIEAKTPSFDTLEEMEEASPVIIQVRKLDKENPVITKNPRGMVVSCYTFSDVEITVIYKDSTGMLSVGDVITVLENETYDEEANRIYHVDGYNKMVSGCSYLLFLSNHSQAGNVYYVAAGINYGTVSLDDDGRLTTRRSIDGSSISDFSYYHDLWAAAREKYIP